MILNALDRDAADGKQARAEMAAELRALLSAPPPAGVDGLTRYRVGKHTRNFNGSDYETYGAHEHACGDYVRLSDAQAIIDGLRGEVATLTVESELGLGHYVNMQKERDQQAQRIGELEGLLRESYEDGEYFMKRGLLARIDAALSA